MKLMEINLLSFFPLHNFTSGSKARYYRYSVIWKPIRRSSAQTRAGCESDKRATALNELLNQQVVCNTVTQSSQRVWINCTVSLWSSPHEKYNRLGFSAICVLNQVCRCKTFMNLFSRTGFLAIKMIRSCVCFFFCFFFSPGIPTLLNWKWFSWPVRVQTNALSLKSCS